MPYTSLRDFMARLEREGRLKRVAEPVSTVLEMTEIQTRLLAEGGPAVLFEAPLGADGARSPIPTSASSRESPPSRTISSAARPAKMTECVGWAKG